MYLYFIRDPDPFVLCSIGIIICTANLLSLGLRKLRQPKVIAEVLGGIILGASSNPLFSEKNPELLL